MAKKRVTEKSRFGALRSAGSPFAFIHSQHFLRRWKSLGCEGGAVGRFEVMTRRRRPTETRDDWHNRNLHAPFF
jgi:hypothetical protein